MFLRIAAKGPAPWLGLLAALLPACAANARTAAPAASRPTRVTLTARSRAVAPSPKAVRAPSNLPVSKPVVKSSAKPLKAKDLNPFGVSARLPLRSVKSPKNHGGTRGQDFNLTQDTVDDVEPQLMPVSTNVVFSANAAPDTYPPAPVDPAKNPNNLPPLGQQEPSFLTGVRDFHMYYNGTLIQIGLDPASKDWGEQFEPNGGAGNLLAFSAFVAPNNDAYKPDVLKPDGTKGAPDFYGLPVRVICTSVDGIAKALTDDPGSIDKVLVPGTLHDPIVYSDTSVDPPVDKLIPGLVPDASPAIWPVNNRYILFVSLRGYDPKDPATHYTSLWLWDTSKTATDVGYVVKVLSVPGMSILHPKFSSDKDGTYLLYTEADIAFDADPSKNGYVPDPVFGIDVDETVLATSFKSRCYLSTFTVADPATGHAANPHLSPPTQITHYADTDGNEPRDMMPFMNDLFQIGFSSDRVDANGDGLADAVQTDPAKAKFDIYYFPFPFDPNCADETVPDSTAHRQTLGDAMVHTIPGDNTSPLVHFDDSNELHGNVAPTSFNQTVFSIFTPDLYYQADDAFPKTSSVNNHGWDIWETNRAGSASYQGNLLIGLPKVTPNSNLSADQLAGLKQTHRSGLPSDFVNITVQVNPSLITYDDNTGAPSIKVYALVKDPDNRIYEHDGVAENTPSIFVDTIREFDATPVKFCAPDFDAYTKAYGEDPARPQIGALILLNSVDAAPDPTKPVYFTGKWFTPIDASDYMVDIIVQDATTDAGVGAYHVADNIGGFSTAPFIPYSRTLLVADFTAGQYSMDTTTQVYSASGVPTESYLTTRPHVATASNGSQSYPLYSTIFPNTDWATLGPRIEWQKAPTLTIDPATGRLVPGNDGVIDSPDQDPLQVYSLMANEYDLWRVQCREPITTDDVKGNDGTITSYGVLHNYVPYTHTQPGYPVPAGPLRTQRVADRCVMWVAPHTGNLNGNAGQNSTEVGTIANLTTQSELLNYINKGGRLLLAGADIAFVLTQNNPNANNPLLSRLKVAFQSDADRDEVAGGWAWHRTELTHARDTNLNGLNPIPYTMWEAHWAPAVEPIDPFLTSPVTPARAHDTRWDGSFSNWHIDGISVLQNGTIGGGELVWNYTHSDRGDNTLPAAVSTHTPTSLANNTSVSKSLYFAFNPDALYRFYYGPIDNTYILCQNVPMEVFHNTIDFFTTGGFQGQVFITNDVASPKDVLVYALDDYNAEALGQVRGTALTDANGNYFMDGLDPSVYFLYAYKTGFSMQHLVRDSVDCAGNGITVDNITLVPTQPGTVTGTVFEKGTSPHQALVGVPVTIVDVQGVVNLTTLTDASGHFTFDKIKTGLYTISTPEGTYTLVVDPTDTTKNETHDYTAYTNAPSTLTVITGTNPAFDIALTRRTVPPSPATLQVTVIDASVDPSVPAENASVSVIDPATGLLAAEYDQSDNPAITGPDGIIVRRFKAGNYLVKVEYTKGTKVYKAQTKTVLLPPDDATPPTVFTKLTFTFGGVLHTFTANKVLMASVPYDYSGTQTSPLLFNNFLGLTAAQLANAIVAFNASTQNFVAYPNFPADTGRVGRGYGFKLPADGKVTDQGTAVSSTTSIIRTETGWNLIGDPYPDSIVWNGTDAHSVKVALRDDSTQKLMTIDDAKTKGYILSDLWGGSSVDANGNSVYDGTYQVAAGTATLAPWQAYWVKVAQPLLFYVPQPVTSPTVKAVRTATTATTPLMPAADVWGVNITATGNAMTDSGLALGISRKATAGIDAGLDLAKPTPMGAGDYLFTSFTMGNAGTYATDVRGLAQSNVWTFTVSTTLVTSPVTLNWTQKGAIPAGYSAVLVDAATGTRTNMSAVNQYAFRTARNGAVRTFRVEVRRASVNR